MPMQFVVPQFIEVESKVIGPISVRQFIILLVTAGFMWVEWELFSFWLAVIIGIITLFIGGTFAFVKINGQNFHIFLLGFIQTLTKPNLQVWRRDVDVPIAKKEKSSKNKSKAEEVFMSKPALTSSRLAEASLMVDTGGVYKPEELSKMKDKK